MLSLLVSRHDQEAGPSDETALYQKHIKRDFGKVKKACKLYRGIFISINWQI